MGEPSGEGAILGVLLRVVRHEFRVLATDRTLFVSLLLLAAIVVYGACNGVAWVRFQEKTLASAHEEETERLGALDARLQAIARDPEAPISPLDDPRSAAIVGASSGVRFAVLPPGPLAAVAIGQSDLLPYYVRVTTQSRQTFLNNDEIENPSHLLSGRCDLGFVIVALYPLVILALSYNLLSSEKEGGTMAMLLSQPVGLRTIVAGKVICRASVVIALAVGLGVCAAWFADRGQPGSSAMLRGAWWVGIVAAYGGFWFASAVAVNALGKESSANALILATAWLAIVLVVPSLVNLAATALYPVPSRVELIQATRDATLAASEEGSQALSKYFEDHPELASPGSGNLDDFMLRSYSAADAVERQVAPLLDRFDDQLARQQALIGRARFLSPAILAQEALENIAGTGRARYEDYLAQVDAFHKSWREFFLPRVFRKAPFTAADFAAMPSYAYREESLAVVSARAAVGLLGIAIPTLVLLGVGGRMLRRYPVTG